MSCRLFNLMLPEHESVCERFLYQSRVQAKFSSAWLPLPLTHRTWRSSWGLVLRNRSPPSLELKGAEQSWRRDVVCSRDFW